MTPDILRPLRQRAVVVVLLAAAAVVAACAVNPATGERELSLVSTSQEIAMGRQADPGIVNQMGLYPDSSVQRYVRELGEALAARSERPDLPWTFRVLDDPTVNAFALPGGFIYVTRGILVHLESEAQLAGVLGHEIGHVTARHGANRMSRAQLAQLGMGLGMVFSEQFRRFGGLVEQSLGLLFLKFGREDEHEADELGLRYMTRLGYDPSEMASVMRMLDQNSALYSGDQGQVPEWLSTHPDPGNRVARINRIVSETPEYGSAATVEGDALLTRLDGITYGTDPRNGFVRDGVFHHPELAFQFTPPAGWQVMNGPTAVQMAPEDGTALLELRLSGEEPGEAARQFAAREGITAGSARNAEVSGNPAVILPFEAAGQDGNLAGEMTWIRYADRTYALMALSTAQGWSGVAPTMRRSVNSFRRETDREILNVEPRTVDVVSLPDPTPWSVFLSRYPSEAEDPQVAVLNQVDEGSALQAGLVKRIIRGR